MSEMKSSSKYGPTDEQLELLFNAVHTHGEFGQGFLDTARGILETTAQAEPCDMGPICIDCEPRVGCPGAQAEARGDEPVAAPQAVGAGLLPDAREALRWLLANIRRDAPQLSGKAMGNAERVIGLIDAAASQPMSLEGAPQPPAQAEPDTQIDAAFMRGFKAAIRQREAEYARGVASGLGQAASICAGREDITADRLQKEIESLMPTAPAAPQAFPERDTSKPAEQQGMFRKFNVERVDGSDRPGCKHHGCGYFVLDLDHDQHAGAAMSAYGLACRDTHPELSAEILSKWPAAPQAGEAEAMLDRYEQAVRNMAIAYTDGGNVQGAMGALLAARDELTAALASQPMSRDEEQPKPRTDTVPGKVHCSVCGFSMVRTNLYVNSGTTGPGDERTEPCPNDGNPLLPVTWEQEAREGWKVCEQMFDRAVSAEKALVASLATLKAENEKEGGPIVDTIWHAEGQTLFEFMEGAVESSPYMKSLRQPVVKGSDHEG